MKAWSTEKISVVALVLLITGAIDSIRNLPATALFGSKLIFFFILSAIIFLIPVALVSAELSSTWSEEEGGIYSWVQNAFGKTTAFIAVWFQWVNTMVWYPTILLFIASAAAYLINPALAENKLYLASVILIVYWGLTFLGLSGIKASAQFASFCALVGMILPMGFIIFLAFIWLIKGHPLAVDFSFSNLIPSWTNTRSWEALTAIMTSFLGMELAAVHVRNVKDPQRNFPKAMFFSVILILCTMIFGSLAIAFVLPQDKISLVSGVLQSFPIFLQAYHLQWLMPIIVAMIFIGSVGSMVNWIISPAKGLMLAAEHGFLPHWLYQLNPHGIPARVLILQAVLVTLFCGGFLLFPSINALYWLFTALSTEIYIMMYLMMFAAAIRLKYKFPKRHRPFAIPGGRLGYHFTCFLGILGCVVTLIVGFFPPEQSFDVGGSAHFRLIFIAGILMMLSPALILCVVRNRKLSTASSATS